MMWGGGIISAIQFSAGRNLGVRKLISRHKVGCVEETTSYRQFPALRKALGIPQFRDDFRPDSQIPALSIVWEDPGKLSDFLRLGDTEIYLRVAASFLRSAPPEFPPYASIWPFLGSPFLPTTGGTGFLWGSLFRPGGIFRNYVSHLKKACILAELLLGWYTPSAIGISRGSKAAQNTSFRFPNYVGAGGSE